MRRPHRSDLYRFAAEWRALRWIAQNATASRSNVELIAQIPAVTAWVEHHDVAPSTISVVMATRNRRHLLERAVGSVFAQTWPHWRLIIVNDGSTDGTAEYLETIDDSRVEVAHTTGIGLSSARNVGLDLVVGDAVTYLDDDNELHPLWLKGVAWAFQAQPDVAALYGARIVENTDKTTSTRTPLPHIVLPVFERAALMRDNYVDAGAMAHRSGLIDARFDERTKMYGDWDLICRLTARSDPLVLPMVAAYYSTSAPNRLTHGRALDSKVEFEMVRDKNRKLRRC
jgi:glycosyltransferase involved in cell wall biosynthesis